MTQPGGAEGHKRHLAVNSGRHLLMVNLTMADVQDAVGAEEIVRTVRKRWLWLRYLSADGAYNRGWLASLAAHKDVTQ